MRYQTNACKLGGGRVKVPRERAKREGSHGVKVPGEGGGEGKHPME